MAFHVRKNFGDRMPKNWQNQEFGGGEKAKFFQKKIAKWFFSDNSDPVSVEPGVELSNTNLCIKVKLDKVK